ncbi:hypothetical protein PSP6_40012 [Paraburkholderia tropica]|nr:hypothetical protein PSP6_40012 [Paraburkholderia tropica]
MAGMAHARRPARCCLPIMGLAGPAEHGPPQRAKEEESDGVDFTLPYRTHGAPVRRSRALHARSRAVARVARFAQPTERDP